MKKIKAILCMSILASCLLFTGCGTTYQEATGEVEEEQKDFAYGYFTVITEWGENGRYKIVYANDTKVKYFVFESGHRYAITSLYNADGTLQIYEEE